MVPIELWVSLKSAICNSCSNLIQENKKEASALHSSGIPKYPNPNNDQ